MSFYRRRFSHAAPSLFTGESNWGESYLNLLETFENAKEMRNRDKNAFWNSKSKQQQTSSPFEKNPLNIKGLTKNPTGLSIRIVRLRLPSFPDQYSRSWFFIYNVNVGESSHTEPFVC